MPIEQTTDPTATPVPADVTDSPETETPTEGAEPTETETEPNAEGAEGEGGEQTEGETETKEPEPEKPVETPEAIKLRKGWAALNREQKKLVEQKRQIATLEKKAQIFDQIQQKLQSDPYGLIKQLGIDFVKLTEAYLENPDADQPPKVDDRVSALEKQLADERNAREQQQVQAQYQQAVQMVTETVKAAGEKFDLVNSTEAYETVCQVIADYWIKHQERLPIEDAAALVEQHLEQEAQRFARSKKFSGPRQAGQTKTTPAKPSTTPTKPRPGATTLNNTSREAPPSDDDLPLDPDARWEALMRKL